MGLLNTIRAHADPAVVEEAGEGHPTAQDIGDALGRIALGREQHSLFPKVGLQIEDEGLRLLLSCRDALGRASAVDGALDGEDLVDAAHRFDGDRRLRQLGDVEQLAAAVGPACGLDHRRRPAPAVIKVVVARIGIGLQDAAIGRQMLPRVFPGPAARIMEGRGRRVGTAERPVVPHVGPQPPRVGLALGQHRNRRVVAVDPIRRQHVTPDRLHDRGERHRTGADTVGQRRRVDRDPLAGEGVALPVQRLVQHELRHQDARQQVRAGKAARDRVGRGRRFGDALAVAARHRLAHVLDDLPPPRFAFERARHDVVELAKPGPAALGTGAGCRIDDPLHRQVIGQVWAPRAGGTALAPCDGGGRNCDVGLGLGRPLALLHVGDGQLELLHEKPATLGGLAELLTPQLGDHELQLLGFEPADQGFAAQRHDHGVGVGEVGRELIGRCRHTPIRSQPSAVATLFTIRPGSVATSAAGFSSRSPRSDRRAALV